MTANLILGNGGGVVLAADTTTTSGEKIRTWDGATELVGLNGPHAIGILHSGSVLIDGLPYLMFLENWRNSLADKPLPRVSDYAESFRIYLRDTIKENVAEVDLLRTYLDDWTAWVWSIHHDLVHDDALNTKGVTRFFEQRARRFEKGERGSNKALSDAVFERLGQGSASNPFEEECRKESCPNQNHASIEGVLEMVFGEHFSDKGREAAQRWASYWLGLFHPTRAGATIAFAGYGSKDLVPAWQAIHPEAFAFDSLFGREARGAKAQRVRPGGGYVLMDAFGQVNEIWRFLNEAGLNPHYSQHIVKDSIRELSREAATSSRPPHDENDSGEAGDLSKDGTNPDPLSLAEAEINLNLAQVEGTNLYRVQRSISNLNLTNLVSVAVRLLGLQNLSQDLRNELPTVGSEICVGVITKADGFRVVDPTSGVPVEKTGVVA